MRKLVAMMMTAGVLVAGAAGVATAAGEKSLDKCQSTAGKVSREYGTAVYKAVAKCLNKISSERIKNVAGSANGAIGTCISAARKVSNQEDPTKDLVLKSDAKIRKACDPAFNPDLLHVEDDVLDGDNSGGGVATGDRMHAERLGAACHVSLPGFYQTGTGGRLGSLTEWIGCKLHSAERNAPRQIHMAYPQGDAWLREIVPTLYTMALGGDLAADDAYGLFYGMRRWVDYGDRVYDYVTGLTWEKKTDDGSIHDKDDTYTWSTGSPYNPTGTAFTTFLNTLNGNATGVGNCTSSDGITQSGGFAGHCDWRLPTIAELQTILLEPSPCSSSPCIDTTIFGPTVSSIYWSATTYQDNPINAWRMNFSGGSVAFTDKANIYYVRAVRGGL